MDMYQPWSHSALAALSLLYFLSPVDLVPDRSLVFGWIDDLAVLAIAYYHWRAVSTGYFFAEASEQSRATYRDRSKSKTERNQKAKSSSDQNSQHGKVSVNDPYRVLGLSAPASKNDIRRAFKNLARENHPDKFKCNRTKSQAHEKMVSISQAYSRLKKVS